MIRSLQLAAVASGASFVRVNVLAGSAWTDQGLIEGQAAEPPVTVVPCAASIRARLMADVNVKHAIPAGNADISHAAIEVVERAGADGVIVTGSATGSPTNLDQVRAVCDVARVGQSGWKWRDRRDG